MKTNNINFSEFKDNSCSRLERNIEECKIKERKESSEESKSEYYEMNIYPNIKNCISYATNTIKMIYNKKLSKLNEECLFNFKKFSYYFYFTT